MNKAKLIFCSIILGFIILLVAQNQMFFFSKHALRINLFFKEYQSPDLYSAVFIIGFFLLGLLIAYFFGLYSKFKFNQTIKGLNQKVNSHLETISRLEAENESLKTELSTKNQDVIETVSEPVGDEKIPEDALPSPDEGKSE